MKKLLAVAAAVLCGIAVLGAAAANLFPDQTWSATNWVEREYNGIVSRMTPIPTGADRSTEEGKIYQGVFEYMIGSNRSKRTIFLSINGHDPSDQFIARFPVLVGSVKKASTARWANNPIRGPFDPSTGRTGVTLGAGSINWLFGDRVEVKVFSVCGRLCGGGKTCQFIKQKGRWTVDSCKDRFVS